MENNKDVLISQLYMLRAGLSLASICNDKISQLKKQIVEPEQQLLDEAQSTLDNGKATYNHAVNKGIKEVTAIKDEEMATLRKSYNDSRYNWLKISCICIAVMFGIAVIWFFVALFIAGIRYGFDTDMSSSMMFPVDTCVGLGIAEGISLILTTTIMCRFNSNKRKTYIERCLEIEKKYNAYLKQMDNIKSLTHEVEERMQNKKKDLIIAWGKYTEQANPYLDIYKATSNVLMANYSKILGCGDWEDLDLVIYYLSSGRADNVKEALLLVDRQKQTDAIINAIHEAERNISYEIRNDFMALGQTMVQCFSLLSKQLKDQHLQTVETFRTVNDNINANTQAVQENTKNIKKQIITDKELKSALIAKMNASSKKLVADLNAMKAEIKKIDKKVS